MSFESELASAFSPLPFAFCLSLKIPSDAWVFLVNTQAFSFTPPHFADQGSRFKQTPPHFFDQGSWIKETSTHFADQGSHFKETLTHFFDQGSWIKETPTHFLQLLIHYLYPLKRCL